MAEKRIPLGHVTIVPKGTYSPSETYNRLDLVSYTNPSNNKMGIYIAKTDITTINTLPTDSNYWMQLMDESNLQGPPGTEGVGISFITGPTIHQAGQLDTYTIHYTNGTSSNFQIRNGSNGTDGNDGITGPAAGFGIPTYSITHGDLGVVVTATGPDNKKVFDFQFTIPEGPSSSEQTYVGITGATATAVGLSYGSNPTVNVQTIGPTNGSKELIFSFGIPAGQPGSSGGGGTEITNPLTFTLNNDKVEMGLFGSGNEANIEIRGTQGGSNAPAIEVTQYNSSGSIINNNRRLTLLDSSGNTYIRGNLNLTNPLSIENGGTGLNTAPSMLTNLETTGAANPLTAEPRPGITGTLSVANGGTSATTAGIDLLDNLGIHIVDNVPTSGTALEGHIYLVCESE